MTRVISDFSFEQEINAVAMTTLNLMPHQKLFIDANELAHP